MIFLAEVHHKIQNTERSKTYRPELIWGEGLKQQLLENCDTEYKERTDMVNVVGNI